VRDATNSRKLAKAEQTLDRIDAEERGEDWERQRNWKYTIEDGERWEEMQARTEESKDKGIIGE
jgi:pre-mRNA-splicing factor SYF2